MKRTWIVLALAVMSLVIAAPALAAGGHECSGDMTTLSSLHHCVDHALAEGHIDSAGVASGLHAKLDAAQAALGRGQTEVAGSLLDALVLEIEAQSGRHIDSEHASHLIQHAGMVQTTLGGM